MEAFEAAKCALQDDLLLVHYDEAKPLVLACDASKYGLGAVLSHIMEDGKERPVGLRQGRCHLPKKTTRKLKGKD